MNQDLSSYYNDRAREYEKVYLNPDEQEDLATATTIFQTIFAGKAILEIACGTGWWTEQISKTASSILATDINKSVVNIARARPLYCPVNFEVADMNQLTTDKKYDGLFGGFIWSHILLQELDGFLYKLKDLVSPGGTIVFIDSNSVKGTIHDEKGIAQTDEYGNTYQARKLEDGSAHLVLKNFPQKDFLFQKLSFIATNLEYTSLKHYWIVSAVLK